MELVEKIQTLYLQQKHPIIITPIMLDIILKSTSMYFLKYCTLKKLFFQIKYLVLIENKKH